VDASEIGFLFSTASGSALNNLSYAPTPGLFWQSPASPRGRAHGERAGILSTCDSNAYFPIYSGAPRDIMKALFPEEQSICQALPANASQRRQENNRQARRPHCYVFPVF